MTQLAKIKQFQEMGIDAQLSRPEFHYGHEKAIILDSGTPQARVLIGDWNLQEGYFGPSHYGPVGARGFAVLDTNLEDAAEIAAYFDANFPPYQSLPTSTRGNLVWSPNAAKALTQFINDAHKTLDVYVAFTDEPSTLMNALIARAKTGVKVRLIGNSSAFPSVAQVQRIRDAGIRIVFDPPGPGTSATMFVHTKSMVADTGLPTERAFVGSQNLFLDESLESILELGAFITDSESIAKISANFERDFSVSSSTPKSL